MKFRITVFLAVIFILLIFVFTGNTKETEVKVRALNGEKIHKDVLEQLPNYNPQVRGQLTDVPVVSLYITKNKWENLTKEEQIDYTYYAESLIPTIKSQPKKYVQIPKSAPLYNTFVNKTKNLCSDCWAIIVGDLIRKDGVTTMTSDEIVVQGDTPWQADDPCCRGINSSEFRRQFIQGF